jgi:hypothetical protein
VNEVFDLDLDGLHVEELEPRVEFARCGCSWSFSMGFDSTGANWMSSSIDSCGCLS